jgi:hypothetical protein
MAIFYFLMNRYFPFVIPFPPFPLRALATRFAVINKIMLTKSNVYFNY